MQNVLKKTFVNILIFIFILSISPYKINAVNVAPLFNVEVSPISAGSVAEYHIYGSYSEYERINILKLYFRADTSFLYPGAPAGSIIVNGNKVSGAQFKKILDDGSIEVTIYLSQYIYSKENIDILIKKEAGLVNPITPATCYKVRVVLCYNSVEYGTILSNTYRITSSQIQALEVNVEPAIKGMKAEYKVSFATGVRGKLDANSGYVILKFPEGTNIPSLISPNSILINNLPAAGVFRENSDYPSIRVYVPMEIPANYFVMILIKSSSGITNTYKAGKYRIIAATSSEPEFVESQEFEIFEPQVQNLAISILPDSIALKSELKVIFKTSPVGYIPAGGKIYIEFNENFDFSSQYLSGNVLLNGEVVTALESNKTVQIITPKPISASTGVEVLIKKEANISNPVTAGGYEIFVYTDSDSFKVPFKVEIKESSISDLQLEATFSGLNSTNEFKIVFKTGPVYSLKSNDDRIIVDFEEGFVFPETATQNLIKVNDLPSLTVFLDSHNLFITVPSDIPPNSIVKVVIPEEFGIKNPSNIGEYGVKVSTTKEPKEIESNKIKITPLPVVEFTVNPILPDGQNGFYKSNPEIILSTSNGIKVFYKVDEGEFSEFTQAFKVPEGMHTVYAYAVDAGGNKGDTSKREFNIDTKPPEVKFDNANSNPVFKGSPGKITGSVSEPCTLKINEVILELSKEKLNFTAELNIYEGMPIAIYARDLAGNAKTMLLSAHIDSTPPTITYLNMPLKLQGVGGSSATIETTESSYTIQLKLDEKGKVYVNNSEVGVIGDSFTYYASLLDGENLFTIKAVDAAGNETTQTIVIRKVNEKKIVLQIGVSTAILEGATYELEAAPFIEKSVTLVPIRFISEAFGATVQWNEELKVITINYGSRNIILQIGSTIAIVDGNINTLQVPPKIVNGRTFVPLRFISEAFGAEVLWDGTTKTITITYTP